MNKRRFYYFVFLFSFVNTAWCAEYGIGIGLNNYNYSIYFPINIKGYRFEPSIAYTDSTSTYSNATYESSGVGFGLFKTISQSEKTKVFFGARINYSEYKSDGDTSGYVKITETSIAPTLGFEYYIEENLSLGGEAYFTFTNSNSTNSTQSKATGSMVTLKYYFK